jgi:hypothetical protein
MSKSLKEITLRDLQRIHWKHYLTRKVVILAAFGCAGMVVEHYLHIWWFAKGGEILIGSVFEHLTFEIPLLEREGGKVAERIAEDI